MRVFNRARTLPDVVRDLFSDSAIVEAMLGLRCTYMINILAEIGCGRGGEAPVETSLDKTVEVLNHTNIMARLKWIDGNCTHENWQRLWNFVISTAAYNKPAEFLSQLENNHEFSAKTNISPDPTDATESPCVGSAAAEVKPRDPGDNETILSRQTTYVNDFIGLVGFNLSEQESHSRLTPTQLSLFIKQAEAFVMNEMDDDSVVIGLNNVAAVSTTSERRTSLKIVAAKEIPKLTIPFTGRVTLRPSATAVPFCNAYGLCFFIDGFSPPNAYETEVTTCLAWLIPVADGDAQPGSTPGMLKVVEKDSTFTFKYKPRSQPIEVKLYSLQSERAMPLGTQLLRDKIEWEAAFKAMHKNAAKMEKAKKLAAKLAQQANGGATASNNQDLIRCKHLLK